MYVLKHIKNKVYLKYYKKDKFKHYVRDINDATIFKDLKDAKEVLNTFRYPTNWNILEINFKTINSDEE